MIWKPAGKPLNNALHVNISSDPIMHNDDLRSGEKKERLIKHYLHFPHWMICKNDLLRIFLKHNLWSSVHTMTQTKEKLNIWLFKQRK